MQTFTPKSEKIRISIYIDYFHINSIKVYKKARDRGRNRVDGHRSQNKMS